MNTLSLNHSSHLRIGIATVSAALLPLLGGLTGANAQSPSSGARLPLPGPQGAPIQRAVPTTPQQIKAARPANSRPISLPPISLAKHPIPTPVQLADPSVLAGPRVALKGHVPSLVAHASKLSPIDPNKELTITFNLQPRNKTQMDELVKRLYDPKDPQFHQFLKPNERMARFSPSVEDFNKVVAFAQQSGLQVTDSSVDRQMVMATGTAARIEHALGIHLENYQAEDGTPFYAPDAEPGVPLAIAPLLVRIGNLTDSGRPRPNIAAPTAPLKAASPQGSGIHPDDIGVWAGIGMPAGEITHCYNLSYSIGSTPLDGAGQHVALVEFSGFDQSNIDYYIYYNSHYASPATSLRTIPVQTIYLNNFDGSKNDNQDEVELDIEMLEAVTDGLDQIDVYEQDAYGDMKTALVAVLNDDKANQVSVSYSYDEVGYGASYATDIANITEELALQGQAVFASSGDQGAYAGQTYLNVNGLAASPWVTGVGGTTLWINENPFGDYGAFSYENAWNDGGATGGGISAFVLIPAYQYNYLINNAASLSSPASYYKRNVPDVALDADPYTGYYVHVVGGDYMKGGTSFACPIWAAFWAQLNQARALNYESLMGFANPALYAIASGGNYNSDFHDVYGGSDNGFFSPEYGYDCTTGLGSIDGLNMINDLLSYNSWAPSESMATQTPSVISGQQIQLTVTLNPPPAGVVNLGNSYVINYAVVTFESDVNGTYSVVAKQTVYGNGTTASVFITAPDEPATTSVGYAAYVTYYDGSQGKVLGNPYNWTNYVTTTITPNTLNSISVSSNAYDGQGVLGTITLNAPAAQNEMVDLYSSDPTHAPVPASVTVFRGSQIATFPINTRLVSTPEYVYIYSSPDSASGLSANELAAALTVGPLLHSVSISPGTITGSRSATGKIVLDAPAPTGGALITLTNTNTAASIPASLTVPAGATSATFPINTAAVSTAVKGTITATHYAAVKKATFTVAPIGMGSLSLSTTSVVGGSSLTGKVTLAAPAVPGSITVSLTSNTPSVANPTVTSLTIPAGSSTGTFTVQTNKVSATTLVSITATANGIKKSKTLKVTP